MRNGLLYFRKVIPCSGRTDNHIKAVESRKIIFAEARVDTVGHREIFIFVQYPYLRTAEFRFTGEKTEGRLSLAVESKECDFHILIIALISFFDNRAEKFI